MTVAAGTAPFRPEPMPQHTSSSFWTKDCVPTASALCVTKTTVDGLRPTPWNIRQAAGVTAFRGMSYGEAVMGVVTWTGKQGRRVTPTARYGVTRTDFKAFVDGGHSCVISIACSVTHNTLRETNDYTGSHSVSAHDYRWCTTAASCYCELKGTTKAATDHSEYLVEDPGTTSAGWKWWSGGLLYRAAEFRTGGNGINCIVFPDTEGVTWKAIRGSQIRTEPSYSDGSKIKSAVIGRTYRGGRTENGGRWGRVDGSYGHGWIHIVYSGAGTSDEKWAWVQGRFGVQV